MDEGGGNFAVVGRAAFDIEENFKEKDGTRL